MHIFGGLHAVVFPGFRIGSGCNVYAIRTGAGVILIDGACEPEIQTIEERLGMFGMRLDDVKLMIATHCHFDHYEAFPEIRRRTGAKILAHTRDAEVVEAADHRTGWHVRATAGLRPEPPPPVPVDQRLEDGDVVSLGDMRLEVIHAPGHTQGSICLYTIIEGRKVLITGDVVIPTPSGGKTGWNGSPTQDIEAYRLSLRRLCAMEVDCVLAGHDNLCLKDGWRVISLATNQFTMDYPILASD